MRSRSRRRRGVKGRRSGGEGNKGGSGNWGVGHCGKEGEELSS